MIRRYVFFFALLFSSAAFADDLADASKLLEAKSYAQGIALLTKLADAGNTDAEVRLGQVYWYGEGVPVDRARADALFAKAAAAGNADAKVAVGMTAARQQHMADIEYWTTKYDGADLTSGQYDCRAPVLPARSTTRDEVKKTGDEVSQWRACYNGFVKNLDDAMPAGKRIPAEIADLMTDQEMDQARAHLDQVYARVASNAKTSADKTLADFSRWQKDTTDYMRQLKIEAEHYASENANDINNAARQPPPPPPIASHH